MAIAAPCRARYGFPSSARFRGRLLAAYRPCPRLERPPLTPDNPPSDTSIAPIDRLLAWTEPVRGELGLTVDLPEANGAQRQRALLAQGTTLTEAYATTVESTRATYAGYGQRTVEVN